jgi:hypothetical protein
VKDEEIEKLRKAARKLQTLENAGVENWEGYDMAMEDINRQEAEEARILDTLYDLMDILSQGIYEPSERGAGFAFTDESIRKAENLMLGRRDI